jgi:hypothetical protein
MHIGNPLPRASIFDDKPGAQDFVPLSDLIQAPLQRILVELAAQTHLEGHVVRCAARIQLIEEPHALLRIR